MPKVPVDGIEYNSEDLSDNGKAQLASLQFLGQQMAKLKNEISVYQTAHAAYAQALNRLLKKSGVKDVAPAATISRRFSTA